MNIAIAVLLGVTLFILQPGNIPFSSHRTSEIQREFSEDNSNPLGLHARYKFSQGELNLFLSWIDKTVSESRASRSLAMVVDKAAYRLILIDSGSPVEIFPIELGLNPYDDKTREGDCCTPEGLYRVEWKRGIGNTSFYKALWLNYPNGEDREQFILRKESGQLSANSSIGGAIEIHGCGSGKPGNGGGRNWTLGCIALSNDNIDILFEKVSSGCPVTIVRYGSALSPHFEGYCSFQD